MQNSFFDLERRYASLSQAGDALERLNAAIDWEIFRPILNKIDDKARKSTAGRRPTCRILMFKLLILQRLHNLSDERLQYQVTDRLSFMRFLGLELSANIPDARTVWQFRDHLKDHQLIEPLFDRLNQALLDMGVQLNSGQIIDATFVPVPIQRNSREDNALIKEGAVPLDWANQPNKRAQKDIDARWAAKGGARHYGYKNHINCDRKLKLIKAHETTDASVHDSQVMNEVLQVPEIGGASVWADSAYRSQDQEQTLNESAHVSYIHERAYRGKPLTDAQKISNTEKSRVRARVEHIFGYQENSMGGIFIRSIGIARAKVGIGLMNLAYNLSRIEVLIRLKKFSFDRLVTPSAAIAA